MPISNALIAFLAEEAAMAYAAQDVLQVEGRIPNVRLPGAPEKNLPDTICGVQFKKSVATGPRGLRPGTDHQEYSIFTGILEVKYGLLRTDNVASQILGCITVLDEKIGIIRACFLRSSRFFTVGRLANLVIDDIMEQTPVYGVDNTNNRERDYVLLPFLITYERVMANMPSA